jgi:hypothetical protein
VAATALLLKVGRTTTSPMITNVSKVGDLMVHSFAARPRAAGWSTKAWSQGIPYLVHLGNLKSLGPKVCFGSKPALTGSNRHFRSSPRNGHRQTDPVGPFSANSGLMHRSGLSHLSELRGTTRTQRNHFESKRLRNRRTVRP